jgi:NADH-quinone oxidoreductase subunit I
LDRFAIDFATCMFCSICIDVCPFDALAWSPQYRFSGHEPVELLIERDTLSTWGAAPPEE